MRRLATHAALGAGVLLVCLALLEAGVLLVVGEQPKFPRRVVGAPFGLRYNEPDAHYRHKSADVTVRFRINARGMRSDRDYGYEKPPGIRRILSLGDSFTIGYEVRVEDTFSAVLERRLRERGWQVEVLNAGVSGYSTAEECLYLERELYRYDPDVVLISFYGNDLVDNARTGLFRLDGGRLAEAARTYVPGGRLADLLNSNAIFNFLSERSNAFVLLKENGTRLWKRRLVEENLRHLEGDPTGPGEQVLQQRRLAAAIFERVYAEARRRGVPLVIQSIPTPLWRPDGLRLVESFPLGEFPVGRPGLLFVSAREVLSSAPSSEALYHERSHGHWTPYSHRLAGEFLAEQIERQAWLGQP